MLSPRSTAFGVGADENIGGAEAKVATGCDGGGRGDGEEGHGREARHGCALFFCVLSSSGTMMSLVDGGIFQIGVS